MWVSLRSELVTCTASTRVSLFFTSVTARSVISSTRRLRNDVYVPCVIHQVASTDRTAFPTRPCVLPAAVEVKVTLLPDWTVTAPTVFLQHENIYVCAECARPWGLTKRGEGVGSRRDAYQIKCDWNYRRERKKKASGETHLGVTFIILRLLLNPPPTYVSGQV